MSEITTIKVKKETREQLASIGRKGETYEDIIQRLLKYYKEHRETK